MSAIKIGILGTADIALKRFIPALKKCENFEYVGVASRSEEKAEEFQRAVGGKIYVGYEELLRDDNIDAVYIPLPPALHYEWTQKALSYGKHVLCEKPFTTCISDTQKLVLEAKERQLVINENYMFMHHKQIEVIKEMALSDKIGAVRLLRANFGFPKRLEGDFRYDKDLGGGALLDCGGYTVKLVSELLGDDAYVADSNLINEDYCVDLYGAVTLKNKKGVVAQVSFGMDNSYVCDFSIWGSKGILEAKRVFTAPPDFMAKVSIIQNGVVVEEAEVEDDHFQRSIEHFYNCIQDGDKREVEYAKILKQGSLVQECFKMSV